MIYELFNLHAFFALNCVKWTCNMKVLYACPHISISKLFIGFWPNYGTCILKIVWCIGFWLISFNICIFFNWCSGGWSPIGSTRHCGPQWPIVPAPGDYDDGEICGMIGRGNLSTRRKLVPVPLCSPQTTHAARTQTRAAAVGSQRLTTWATARSSFNITLTLHEVQINVFFPKNTIQRFGT
jgi:hypothetical protein